MLQLDFLGHALLFPLANKGFSTAIAFGVLDIFVGCTGVQLPQMLTESV